MPRPKKDYMILNMKVESGVMKRFADYCDDVGQTKTLAFERIVTDYLDRYDKEQRLYAAIKQDSVKGAEFQD